MGKSTGDIDANSSIVSVNLSTDTDNDVSDKAGGRKENTETFFVSLRQGLIYHKAQADLELY